MESYSTISTFEAFIFWGNVGYLPVGAAIGALIVFKNLIIIDSLFYVLRILFREGCKQANKGKE